MTIQQNVNYIQSNETYRYFELCYASWTGKIVLVQFIGYYNVTQHQFLKQTHTEIIILVASIRTHARVPNVYFFISQRLATRLNY